MKSIIIIMIFTASCLNAINFKEGQSDDNFIWVGGGVGSLVTADGSLVNINTSINYLKNDRIFKLRGIFADELVVLGPRPNDEVWELGLLYGRHSTKGKVSVSYLAGISYTGGIYKGDLLGSDMLNEYYEELSFETIGIPMEVQLEINALQFIGFSVIMYADINLDKIYGGVNLSIIIGHLP